MHHVLLLTLIMLERKTFPLKSTNAIRRNILSFNYIYTNKNLKNYYLIIIFCPINKFVNVL